MHACCMVDRPWGACREWVYRQAGSRWFGGIKPHCTVPRFSIQARRGLPPRCSKEWYMKTFLGGQGTERGGEESIWDLVKHFNMYDPMALIMAIPPLSWVFFDHTNPGGRHVDENAHKVWFTKDTHTPR